MNTATAATLFSSKSDEWTTPSDLFEALNEEFKFDLDAAATKENRKVIRYFDAEIDALTVDWNWNSTSRDRVWLNPPYSRVGAFMEKAAHEAAKGCTVVCLVPARTDTRWWHRFVWDATTHKPRTGVEVRLLKGRLRFSNAKAGAPFPSALVIFRGMSHE